MRIFHSFILTAVLSLTWLAVSESANAGENTLALIALEGEQDAVAGARSQELNTQRRELMRSGAVQQSPTRAYAIDYVGGDSGTALNFTIKLSGSVLSTRRSASMDFGNCVSGLPSSHMGECRFNSEKGELKVVIFSMSNASLGTGSIGTIRLPLGVSASLKSESATLSDNAGNKVDLELL